MQATTLRISDIMTTDIIYFDEDCKQSCQDFCRKRSIDCLPMLEDAAQFYHYDQELNAFKSCMITPKRIIGPQDPLFSEGMKKRFQEDPILFVHDHGELVGMIHFADYNHLKINTTLYHSFHLYEKMLRSWLRIKGLTNIDMATYQESLRNPKAREAPGFVKKMGELRNKPKSRLDFEDCYLGDLIGLAQNRTGLVLNPKVNKLRNQVMHAHEFVQMDDVATADYIYTFTSFETFFDGVLALICDIKRLQTRMALEV